MQAMAQEVTVCIIQVPNEKTKINTKCRSRLGTDSKLCPIASYVYLGKQIAEQPNAVYLHALKRGTKLAFSFTREVILFKMET